MSDFKAPPKLRPLLADPAQPFIHRDLSWLQFNERVLGEARVETNPILERVKFLAISSSNLDEFFMIRMASLGRSIALEMRKNNEANLRRLRRIRAIILESASKMIAKQAETLDKLSLELAKVGVHIVVDPRGNATTEALGRKLFTERVLPELEAPLPFAPNQLSLLENLQMAVVFEGATWIRIPKRVRSVLTTRDEATGHVYVFFLSRLLATYLGQTIGQAGDPVIVRLTRDADLTVELDEEDTESIPDVVLTGIRSRDQGRAVRLQYIGKASKEFLRFAHEVLKLAPQQIFSMPAVLGLHRLWSALGDLPPEIVAQPGLVYPALKSVMPHEFAHDPSGLFDYLKKRDFLLHHPYDSFDAYVNFIRAACKDPGVIMIQQTVYRMDALSPVLESLKLAAKTKRVRVLIELRARFDEMNNLRMSDELRKAGVEVAFGFGKLKLHAKVALVTRLEEGKQRLYTHLSTGNYNSLTARLYTDLAVLTANEDIGEDAAHFFDSVIKGELPTQFRRLVHAPTKLHRRILQLIDAEIAFAKAGQPARIVTKVNTLVDDSVVAKLYSASQAGVKIDLVVRGACSLVPGIKGLSENIRVVSIVDRFLEHSRIYFFEGSRVMYLSSADWMQRNFFSRLELAFPVLDNALYEFIEKTLLATYLCDNVKGRELQSDGTWKRLTPAPNQPPLRSQFYFDELAQRQYKGTTLE